MSGVTGGTAEVAGMHDIVQKLAARSKRATWNSKLAGAAVIATMGCTERPARQPYLTQVPARQTQLFTDRVMKAIGTVFAKTVGRWQLSASKSTIVGIESRQCRTRRTHRP